MTAEVYGQEDLLEQRGMPRLRLITGGKGPPDSGGDDWLSPLKKGAVFACKEKRNPVDLILYGISFKHTKTIVLFDALGLGPPKPVDPVEFSKKYLLHEVIEEGGQRPEGVSNDSSGSVRPSGVGHDEDAPGRQPTDESA